MNEASEATTESVTVPLRLAPTIQPARNVLATVIPASQREFLAKLLYVMPPRALESVQLAVGRESLYLVADVRDEVFRKLGDASGWTAVAVGAAAGCFVGGMAGGLIAQANPWNHNEWDGLRGAKTGGIAGAVIGGVGAAFLSTSPETAVVLGMAGAATGTGLGIFLNEARQ